MNPGAAPTPALSGRVTRRTAWNAAGAALVSLGAWALLVRAWLATDGDPGIPPAEVLVGALYFGGPYALAAATGVVAASRVAVGVDAPARLLALATSGRRGRRDEWGAAMRAELASITASPRERLRFAAGCALIALRRGWGRSPWVVAAACAALFAALTVATSRASLDGSRTGSLWAVIYGPPQAPCSSWGSSPRGADAQCALASSTPSRRSPGSSWVFSPPPSPRARCGPARQACSSSTAMPRPRPSPPAGARSTR
jgi:hypothetical protein